MYLTIMVTVLVLSQIVRVIQNAIHIHKWNKQLERDLAWIKDRDISERDFDVQREVFYLLREKLLNEADNRERDRDPETEI